MNIKIKRTKPETLYILLFILLAAFWGGSFIAIKQVITTMPPIRGAFFRVLIGLFSMFAISSAMNSGEKLTKVQKLKSMFVGIFSIGIPFSLLFTGEKYISAGLAGVLNGTVPIWTLIIALIFVRSEKKRVTLKVLGAIVGFLGIVVISWPSLQAGAYEKVLGIVLLIGMAISYAIGTNLSKVVMTGKTSPQRVSLYQHISAAMFLLVVTYFMTGNPFDGVTKLEPLSYAALFYMGIFSNGIAFTIFFYLMRAWNATKVSTVTFIVPIFSLGFDFIFFGNLPSGYDFLGALIIFSSMFLVFKANQESSKS